MRKTGKVLGLIPARAGSKGVPGKNLAELVGKPLVGWVAEAGRKSELIDDVIVSSDGDDIMRVAREYGAEAPFRRPAELSDDHSLVVDVIAHALKWLAENDGRRYEYACLLQPTSPLALPEDYDRAICLAYERDADTVMSVHDGSKTHPATHYYTLDENGRAEFFIKSVPWNRMSRRQDLPRVYVRCGVVYVLKTRMILAERTLYGERIHAIEVPIERAVGIDTPLDLKLAEVLMRERVAAGKGKRTS